MFFYAEEKLTLAKLGRTHQLVGEDMDAYMRHFHEIALDCCNAVDALVDVCLHDMMGEYCLHLVNISFLPLPRLMKAARRIHESLYRTIKSDSASKPSLKLQFKEMIIGDEHA